MLMLSEFNNNEKTFGKKINENFNQLGFKIP